MRCYRLGRLCAGLCLLVAIAGMSGCSQSRCCHSQGCGVGLGRPLLDRLRNRHCVETTVISSTPVVDAPCTSPPVVSSCDCGSSCRNTCHFTLSYWPFSWRLFGRDRVCDEHIILHSTSVEGITTEPTVIGEKTVAPELIKPPKATMDDAPQGPQMKPPALPTPKPELKPRPMPMTPTLQPKPVTEQSMVRPTSTPETVYREPSTVRQFVDRVVHQTVEVVHRVKGPSRGVEMIQHLPTEAPATNVAASTPAAPTRSNEPAVVAAENLKMVSSAAEGSAKSTAVVPAMVAPTTTTDASAGSTIKLRIYDLDDPAPQGRDLDYVIQVTNSGTVPAMDLRLRIECPAEVQPVAFTNAPEITARGQTIEVPSFDLAACGTKLFRLRVRTLQTGDIRFKVDLSSQGAAAEAHEEESTRIYSPK